MDTGSVAMESSDKIKSVTWSIIWRQNNGSWNRRGTSTDPGRDQRARTIGRSVPMHRLGIADDFGPVCAFLCSRLASYITGQSIAVDGGLIHGMS